MPYAGHPAAGGDTVVITGTNFGPTAAKKALSSSTPAPAATISVTYGAGQVDDTTGKTTYTDFTAKNCAVSASVGLGNTQIECETAGLSKQVKASEMRWVVTVGGDTAKDASTQMTTFRPPTITAVTAAAALPTMVRCSV